MKLSRKRLKILIENFLKNESIVENVEYFTVTSQVSDYEGVDNDVKEFLRLVGYVCVFEILTPEQIEAAGGPSLAGKSYVQVTSGKRDGMTQLDSWLDKIAAGETREETLSLYNTDPDQQDPFMSEKSERIATLAYDRLVKKLKDLNLENNPQSLKGSSELHDIARMIDVFPVSAHLAGESLDLRSKSGKGKYVVSALEFIKENNLASFHFQEELKPPHIHLGPLSEDQDEWLTPKGYQKLKEYDERAIAIDKYQSEQFKEKMFDDPIF